MIGLTLPAPFPACATLSIAHSNVVSQRILHAVNLAVGVDDDESASLTIESVSSDFPKAERLILSVQAI